jgi:uncharacterized protein
MDTANFYGQTATIQRLTILFEGVEEGHGILHAIEVLNNAWNAIRDELLFNTELTPHRVLAIQLAALLHDADDRKIFPVYQGNAKRIVTEVLREDNIQLIPMVNLIEEMISLVSASRNKEVWTGPDWMTIPRDADRLEAIGWIGVVRCYNYCKHIGTPLFTPDTPRVTTEEELARIATPERFKAYTGGSLSMIDHFYDKLVHVSTLETKNPWLLKEAAIRRQVMIDFLFEFGRTGTIDESRFAQ